MPGIGELGGIGVGCVEGGELERLEDDAGSGFGPAVVGVVHPVGDDGIDGCQGREGRPASFPPEAQATEIEVIEFLSTHECSFSK